MKQRLLDADFALALPAKELDDPENHYHWTGWKRHHWPADVIESGVRFYAFNKQTRHFEFLLEVIKGGTFTYQSLKEFHEKVTRITGWEPAHEGHWFRIPYGKRRKPYIGFAIRWKMVKPVNIYWNNKFQQIGWMRVGPSDDLADEISEFTKKNKHLTNTMQKRLVDSRLGQGDFRAQVLSYWRGCAVTGCTTKSLLRASHIKPWRECNNRERLDPYNGLALIPNLDAAFDLGLISFQDDGRILISPFVNRKTQNIFGINSRMRIKHSENQHKHFEDQHLPYLKYHREEVFRKR